MCCISLILLSISFACQFQGNPSEDAECYYEQGLDGVNDKHKVECVVAAYAIEDEHGLHGEVPGAGTVGVGTMTAMEPTMNVTSAQAAPRWEVASKQKNVR